MPTQTFPGSPVRKAAQPVRDISLDRDWINDHADELRGQWVMVCEGRLIAADPDIRHLLSKIPKEEYPDALVTYVPTEKETERLVL